MGGEIVLQNQIDSNKYLGTLCKRGHDYKGTGMSLRYIKGGSCLQCMNIGGKCLKLKCHYCKKSFLRKVSRKKHLTAFCSQKCYGMSTKLSVEIIKINNTEFTLGPPCKYGHYYKNTNKSLRYNPPYNKKIKHSVGRCVECAKLQSSKRTIKKTCLFCGKTIYKKKWGIKKSGNCYCDRNCYYKSKRKPKEKVKCSICKKTMKRSCLAVKNNKSGIFFCVKCRSVARAKIQRGVGGYRVKEKHRIVESRTKKYTRKANQRIRNFINWKKINETQETIKAVTAWVDCKLMYLDLILLIQQKEKNHA